MKKRDKKFFKTALIVEIGVTIILFVIAAIVYFAFSAEVTKKSNKANQNKVVAEPVTFAALATESPKKVSSKKNVNTESFAVKIKIQELPEETLKLLGNDEEKLKQQIKIFLNQNGYVDISEVYYAGETIINHEQNTTECVFTFKAEALHSFSVLKKDNKFKFELW